MHATGVQGRTFACRKGLESSAVFTQKSEKDLHVAQAHSTAHTVGRSKRIASGREVYVSHETRDQPEIAPKYDVHKQRLGRLH